MSYTVVALGIVNAGKSSLLSALAGRDGLFPSADVPGVTTRTRREQAGPLSLVDTPGLDAEPDEAATALKAVERADTVLWCHSLCGGELRPTEIQALRGYPHRLLWRTCFVLTHRDAVDDEDLRLISGNIARQLRDALHLPFAGVGETVPVPEGRTGPRPFDLVAVPYYWRAASSTGKRRAGLERRSGVVHLRAFLGRLARAAEERSA